LTVLPGTPADAGDRRRIFGVGELARLIKATLEDEIGPVWVEGEISNFHLHSSGHMYFTLKDAAAQIQAVLFRMSARRLAFPLKDGLKIRAYGKVTAYTARSQYQIVLERVEAAGAGSLQEQFEKLKERLSKEGLFDSARKRPLPALPQRIGIVTSPTGAAIRDMLNILGRRFPNLYILIAPVKVQGEGAAAEIAAALDDVNRRGGLDLLIVGRGGGSLEDLWAFNEEIVARAIARSGIPVISAVGHETDFTISDFVADLRAPTPSAAAELAVRAKAEWEEALAGQRRRLARALQTRALEFKNRLTRAARSYVFREPRNLVRHFRQRLDGLQQTLAVELRGAFTQAQQRVDEAALRMAHRARLAVQACSADAQRLSLQLRALNPTAVLERGYSITRLKGRIVRRASDARAGDELETRVASGTIFSSVTSATKEGT
jgi:exodeoxyribonuclease VII large subunit